MQESIADTIRSLQIRADSEKISLELDGEVRKFLELLLIYPEALTVLFQWIRQPKPIIIVSPPDFNFTKLKSHVLDAVRETRYIRDLVYSMINQFSEIDEDNSKIMRINEFLEKASNEGMLDLKNETAFYCFECGSIIVTNARHKPKECSCGSLFDLTFRIATIPEKISKELATGHLLELYALHVMRKVKRLELVGMVVGEEKASEKRVYTSIQYAGLGVRDKENGELDLIGVRDSKIITIECKFNETTRQDIEDFLGVSDNLYFIVKEKHPELKRIIKAVFSYDGSKLKPTNGLLVVSFKNIVSIEDLTNYISKILE